MSLYHKDLISIDSLSKAQIRSILDLAKSLKKKNNSLIFDRSQILATLFFEPSTRTRLSFESAMIKLGGSIIGHLNDTNSSKAKGESLEDSLKVISSYADALVIRHPCEGSAQFAADICDIPVINAGDGSNEHPTQTLLDLFSIEETQHRLDDLHIAFVGDLKYGRTVHSLAKACAHYSIRLYFISPHSLTLPKQIANDLSVKGVKYSFHHHLDEIIDKLDIVYMTRIQKERFESAQLHQEKAPAFQLKHDLLKKAKPTLKILHPLPKVHEIEASVDRSPYAYYFEQAKNGLFIRQALLAMILDKNLSYKKG